MYISLNGTYLTNDGSGAYTERQVTAAQEVTFNGKRIAQLAQFLRAVAISPYDRGNLSQTLRFKVSRGQGFFNTLADAESFLMGHFSSLPGSGPLLIICGLSSDPPVACTGTAVLEGLPKVTYKGVSVICEYSLVCGSLTYGSLPASISIDCGTT